MSQTWVRVIAGLIAIAVVLVVGINVVGSIDLTPDPNTGVPVGFDAVHHELQRRIQSTGDAADAVEATVRRAGELLAPFGVADEVRELTALLYLVDLAARYLADRQAEAGARLGVLGTWLLPVLIRRVEEL